MNFYSEKAEKILNPSKITMIETRNTYNTGSWDSQKAMLKNRFANLTDQDLAYEAGKGEEMFENLMLKLGKNKQEMASIIAHL